MSEFYQSSPAARDQAIAWLLRLRDSPTDQAIRQAFQDWLAADPSHEQAYRLAEAHWAWMEPFRQQPFKARDEALRYRPGIPKTAWRKWVRYSAAAVLLIGIGLALFAPFGWYGLSHSYVTDKGQRRSLTLSDGSALELNTDTEIRVRFNHSQRHVDLVRGEAFFNVTHDAKRPFTVHVDNVSIRDIGTAFDVYKQSEQISVTVQEGFVEIEGQTGKRRLNAGQQLAYRNDGRFVTMPQPDIDTAIAWRQGQLIFRGRPLLELLTEISRYHDVEIRLPDPKLAELRVNGSFRTEQLDHLLNAIATLLPVNVKRIGEREIVLEASANQH